MANEIPYRLRHPERVRAQRRKWRQNNRLKVLEAKRRYRECNREKIRSYLQIYREKHVEKIAACQRMYRKKKGYANLTKIHKQRNPEKHRARMEVYKAIRRGIIVRPGYCSRCGLICRPEAHHADYTKPLEIKWLCRGCHCFIEGKKLRGRRRTKSSGGSGK